MPILKSLLAETAIKYVVEVRVEGHCEPERASRIVLLDTAPPGGIFLELTD